MLRKNCLIQQAKTPPQNYAAKQTHAKPQPPTLLHVNVVSAKNAHYGSETTKTARSVSTYAAQQ